MMAAMDTDHDHDTVSGEDTRTNLIVNYVPQTLSDQEFREMFAAIGPINVTKTKIIRDRSTGYSYGFGFVEYDHNRDAVMAIEQLNGVEYQHKRLKVAFARPQGEQSKQTNLYIRGLPKNITAMDLEELFTEFGTIINCKILSNKGGECTGVGFVLFELKDQAARAMELMTGKMLPGGPEPLNIKFAEENAKKVRPPPMLHPPPPPPRGYFGGPIRNQGFRYPNRYNPMMGGGLSMPAPPGSFCANGGDNQGYTLYVYNIGPYAEERQLWSLFSAYGRVLKVNVIWDHAKNMCKNYGFVTMANGHDADNSIAALNGRYYMIDKPLQVSYYNKKT
ncbi:ELAV-like protein 1-B [Lineus longissimus]|uniref:ELAV-like protein 1-B n=1 Tax=Lineus longissimus TaxID=88925 RepID=UPI00315D0AC4